MFEVLFPAVYVVAIVTIVAAAITSRRPRTDFRGVGDAFVAPTRLSWRIVWFGLALSALLFGASSLTSGAHLAVRILRGLLWAGVATLALWGGVGALTSRSRLVIRRDGVTVDGVFARRVIAWTDASDLPQALVTAGVSGLPGYARKRWDGIGLPTIDVDARPVIQVIAYYHDHPQERAEIGNPSALTAIP